MTNYADMLVVLKTTKLSEEKFLRLKHFLSDFCDEESIMQCSTVDHVIDLLKRHLKIYIFNIDTLSASCNLFCSSKATTSIRQYRQKLDDFLSNTSVKDFKGALETQFNSIVESVTLVLNEMRNENTLRALTKLVYHFVGSQTKVFVHTVYEGLLVTASISTE